MANYLNKPYESWEHDCFLLSKIEGLLEGDVHSKYFGNRTDVACYRKLLKGDNVILEVGYFIGVDWLVEHKQAIIVAPKFNTRPHDLKEIISSKEVELDDGKQEEQILNEKISVNYFAMLQQCLLTDYVYKEIDNLVQIDWKAKEIPIQQSQDWLSPLLIVKFLNVLKSIVRKGLKKSYYPVTRNLRSKIKGKILVGQNIKQNVVKNRFTQTICNYEIFGIDSAENRLLNKAFQFACSYLENHQTLFGKPSSQHFSELMSFCRSAFESISSEIEIAGIKAYKPNPFFKEYTEGIQLAKLILKRYAYTISNTTKQFVTTPPYWIDMPRLFELYVYHFLKKRFPEKGAVTYHFNTYGNELDFLINDDQIKMVVDAKYKPAYIYSKYHSDIRQVAGYARLEKVYQELELNDGNDKLIDCLIIYPDVANGLVEEDFKKFDLKKKPITEYKGVYKIGIKLETI